MKNIKKPNPGSKEAQELGCTCPVIDNHYGEGMPTIGGTPNFWINMDCLIHNEVKDEKK